MAGKGFEFLILEWAFQYFNLQHLSYTFGW